MTIEALAKQGRQYMPVTLAASVINKTGEIRKKILRESFSSFPQAPYRLETVANIHGIEFINDSGACSIHSTWFSMESMGKPVIWIAGGLDSVLDYSELASLVAKKVKAIIYLGHENEIIRKAFDDTEIPVIAAADMKEAVSIAYYIGKTGDAVLLSPGCPSKDRFEDFELRGDKFRVAVKDL